MLSLMSEAHLGRGITMLINSVTSSTLQVHIKVNKLEILKI